MEKIKAIAKFRRESGLIELTIKATVYADDNGFDVNKKSLQMLCEDITETFEEQILQNNFDGLTLNTIEVEATA
jgi:hypothetical protein